MTDITANDPIDEAPQGKPPAVASKMVFVLSMAGLLSGLLIVLVYEFTLPMIEANRARALREAVFKVVPGSSALQRLEQRDGKLVAVPDDSDGRAIYGAYNDDGDFMGYAIPGQGVGFQDVIRLIFGFNPTKRHVVGLEILESKETPGLGDKIFKDAPFQENFRALEVAPEIVLVKNGTKTAAHEVDSITGATISSKAVVNILNAANKEWLPRIPAENHPPLQKKPDEKPDENKRD
ncbi:MAG: FMN-binding protein [Planctomycetota bacterium]|jgi:electron transport complex protein RnfG